MSVGFTDVGAEWLKRPTSVISADIRPSKELLMTSSGRTIVLAGATSAAGLTTARALIAAGAHVIATGRSAERLAPLLEAGAQVEVADATVDADMTALAERLDAVDGVVSLVGGWRGGGGLAGQSDEDFAALLPALQAVRVTSRAFDEKLRASDAGRFAIVSSTAVLKPLAGGANYVTVKAAAETWARAVAQGYAKAARDAGADLRTASVILRVEGGLDAGSLARAVVALWDVPATDLNASVVGLAKAD
jgi:NAD(P)-dependent dehydrogenase (short-subunit alcohol dehydrogenase family)